MDTRLKNNKNAVRAAVVVIVLAAAVFSLICCSLEDRVEDYYIKSGSDFEGEGFIGVLFRSNYVLWCEVLEKSGKEYRAEDLYLAFEEEEIPETMLNVYEGNETIYDGSSTQIRAEYSSELQESLSMINSVYTMALGRMVDYCVIDESTQTILKNTAREPERLREDENTKYAYYLIINYDQHGSISGIRAYGSDPEQFLKNAQLVAGSTDALLLDGMRRSERFAVAEKVGVIRSRVTVTQKNPQNATFIYAMTEEQMDNFSWIPVYRNTVDDTMIITEYVGGRNKELAYERVGTGRLYLLCLAAIMVIFFFISRYAPQWTADTAGTRRCAELIVVIMFLLAFGMYASVVKLTYYVNETIYLFRPVGRYGTIFGVVLLLFGAWYWCLLSIRSVFRGVRPFIRERSLIYRYWSRIVGFFRGVRDRWKKFLADADLGKDNRQFLRRLVATQFVIVSLICCCWFFGIMIMVVYSWLLYLALVRYASRVQSQYSNLLNATNAIARGKFDNTFEGDFGIFESYKSELYQIQGGFRDAVEEEVRSQRMKTELITNVSHDLKTPLTAIITYVDLLKGENVTEEQKRSYLDTLERKSLRMKVLIEDLFEISKASSGNVKLEPVSVDICNLLRQVCLEHEDRMKEKGLDIRFDLPEEKVILQLDSQKTYRIFENLYVNITKYAMKNTRVYVHARQRESGSGGGIHIELKNISEQELTVNPADLTERFVRGDASRNTEGSGLGLAIAKSFTELQGGTFAIETDGDLFKAVIEWQGGDS